MKAPKRPPSTLPELRPENIPEALRALDQWVGWWYGLRGPKWTKVPLDASTGDKASTTDVTTWSSFDAAVDAATAHGWDGIGFVFSTRDPFTGLDLDDCLDDHDHPVTEARDAICAFDSYSEVSPSGKGVKIFVRACLPGNKGRRAKPKGFAQIEVYNSARFFTVTGWHVPATPKTVEHRQDAVDILYARYFGPKRETGRSGGCHRDPSPANGDLRDDDALIAKAMGAQNGRKFRRLWGGEITGYPSHSEADLALCSILAFYCGDDLDRIDRVFRRSGLCRDKWTDRADYREETIRKAIEGPAEFYKDPKRETGGPARTVAPPRLEGPHDLGLEYRVARFTGTRWTVEARLRLKGQDVGPFNATATCTGRQRALSQVSELIGEAGHPLSTEAMADVRRWLRGALDPDALPPVASELADLAETRSRAGGRQEPARVAAGFLKDTYGFAFRDPDGSLWSERLGHSVKSHELQQLGGPALLAELRDRARGFVDPCAEPVTSLGRSEKCGRAAWGILKATLPPETGAELGPDSAAAARLRAQIIEALDSHQHRVGLYVKDQRGYAWVSSTLASLARDTLQRITEDLDASGETSSRLPGGGWLRLHDGFDAWTSVRLDGDRIIPLLAIRPALLVQTHVTKAGRAREPKAVTMLARRYGLLDTETPGVCVESSDGVKLRALLLAPELTREVLSTHDDGEEEVGQKGGTRP